MLQQPSVAVPDIAIPEEVRALVLGNQHTPMAVLRNGMFAEVNAPWLEMLGYDVREELIGKHAIAVLAPESHLAAFRRIKRIALGETVTPSHNYRFVGKDGTETNAQLLSIRWPTDPTLVIAACASASRGGGSVELPDKSPQPADSLDIDAAMQSFADLYLRVGEDDRVISFLSDDSRALCAERFVGRQLRDVLPAPIYDLVDRAQSRARSSSRASYGDCRVQIGGEEKSLEIRALPQPNGQVISVIRDVTDYRRMVTALRESDEAVRGLLNALPDPAFLTDRAGTITTANDALARRLGRKVDNIVGKPMVDLLPPDVAAEREAMRATVVATGKPVRFEDSRAGRHYLNHLYPVFASDGTVAKVAVFALDITDRERAEKALRESEIRLRTLVNNIPGAVYRCAFGREWVMEFVSPAIEKITGHTAAELTSGGELSFGGLIHPDDREAVWTTIRDAISRGEPFATHYRLLHRDGSVRWVSDRGQACLGDDGHVRWVDGAVFDISTRVSAENALRQSEERYRSIVENTRDLIMVNESDGSISYLSPAFEAVTGHRRGEFVQGPHNIHPDDRDAVADVHTRAMRGEPGANLEYRIITGSGDTKWLSHTWTPIMADGRLQCVVSVIRDITEQKQAAETLQHAHDDLEKAYNLQREFLNNVTHEVRTPLTAVRGYTEMLLEGVAGPLNPDQVELLQRILASSRSLLDIVASILEIARLRSGATTLRPKVCKPCRVVEQAATSLIPQAREKGIEISLDLHGQDCMGMYDQEKLAIILNNLLTNAVKFTERGRVEVIANCGKSGAEVIIADTGIGIRRRDLSLIFDEFRQMEYPGKHKAYGFGLGLAIVANMVDCIGASLTASSRKGVGTAFTLHVPTLDDRSSAAC